LYRRVVTVAALLGCRCPRLALGHCRRGREEGFPPGTRPAWLGWLRPEREVGESEVE
jgi:hypothetical protein